MVNPYAECRYCGLSEPVVRFGLNRSVTQRLWCKSCRKAWTPRAKSRALSGEKEALIASALGERLSQRAIATCPRPHLQSGAHHNPHHNPHHRPKKAQASRLSFSETLLPAIAGDALEIDELVIRFRFKRRYLYLWIAISRLTHQVISFWIGDRSFKGLWEFWFSLPPDYRKKLVYTDFYEAYAKRLAAWQHRLPPGSTGQALKAAENQRENQRKNQSGRKLEQQVEKPRVRSGQKNHLRASLAKAALDRYSST